MTPAQAAKIIGCTSGHVRVLIRRNKIAFTQKKSENNQFGYIYSISKEEAERVRDTPLRRGRRRGPLPTRRKRALRK